MHKYRGKQIGDAPLYIAYTKAKAMLAAREKSVTEISYELGFSSPQYFCKSFLRNAFFFS